MKTILSAVLLFLLAIGPVTAGSSEFELRLVAECTSGMKQFPPIFSDKKPICVASELVAGGTDVIFAKPHINKITGEEVELTLAGKAKERLAEATKNNVGHQIAILSDGKLVTATIIMAPIRDGKVIFGAPIDTEKRILSLFQDRAVVK